VSISAKAKVDKPLATELNELWKEVIHIIDTAIGSWMYWAVTVTRIKFCEFPANLNSMKQVVTKQSYNNYPNTI
jgi:hypothetical protein